MFARRARSLSVIGWYERLLVAGIGSAVEVRPRRLRALAESCLPTRERPQR
jgi:hypothetical protein